MEPKERGNNNVHRGPASGKEKRFRAAFMRLYDADPAKLDALALTTHNEAAGGNIQAATFIRDTLDGRPAQEVIGEGGGPLVVRILKVAADGTKDD